MLNVRDLQCKREISYIFKVSSVASSYLLVEDRYCDGGAVGLVSLELVRVIFHMNEEL